ncbi:hypothetical protein PR003_g5286 [Phytophthora rubi]|uniref:Uncharacterized protein n=1 Tax=Phytophthora rubi TaxID=129364 RepID=A0A6A3N7A9_9STRA|nr:hypothetical protein PR001_g16374 [Phytophthora rubi]KAE9039520.1 hypothetical protein PR002_g5453 [Phytophthora rubi]KAE9350638.1 hypothetical protein PR003_g5286 [Phytophthora rubi]
MSLINESSAVVPCAVSCCFAMPWPAPSVVALPCHGMAKQQLTAQGTTAEDSFMRDIGDEPLGTHCVPKGS